MLFGSLVLEWETQKIIKELEESINRLSIQIHEMDIRLEFIEKAIKNDK